MGPIETTLSRAYALIEDPKRWCQGTYARDREGVDCDDDSEMACSWCVEGAILRVGTLGVWFDAQDFLEGVSARWLGFGVLPHDINDDLGHLPTLCLLKTAIAEAREQGV